MKSFEYDPKKSKSNEEKHGIDFEEAKELWKDINAVEFKTQFLEEDRYIVIGRINDKNWTAVITYRDETIRIISVRRPRKKEIEWYENQNNNS